MNQSRLACAVAIALLSSPVLAEDLFDLKPVADGV